MGNPVHFRFQFQSVPCAIHVVMLLTLYNASYICKTRETRFRAYFHLAR